MNKPVKTKLCWNCEGSVSRSAENCPYCAVYLSPEKEDLSQDPPYSKQIPKAPYNPVEQEEVIGLPEAQELATTGFRGAFLPLILLSTGLISLFFSLILFLFAENGKLTLQWDGSYWYIYLLLALPLLYFGWRYLETTDR